MLQTSIQSGEQEHLPSMLSADSLELSRQLQLHQQKTFPPNSQKAIRNFSPAEASYYIGIGEGYLRQVASEGYGPE
ncbi:MAG: plasmid partitioning protein RepA, partial [Mesorhizobium sp.]